MEVEKKDIIELVFKDSKSENTKSIFSELESFAYKCIDEYYYELEEPCNSSGCNNESFNGCDCEGQYEDYEFSHIVINKPNE